MRNEIESAKKQVIKIIALATLVRLVLAMMLELGNDEVYYWTYALYPDFSHFDHPPMVGIIIQASTLNALLTNDFFMRLGPIAFAAGSTWLMYRMGVRIKDERTGLIASVLFTSSVYCSLIAGFAIIPDAPQVFFWLLSLYLMLDFLPARSINNTHRREFMLFGLLAGLAILSKYHSVFLWAGVLGYMLFCNRNWFKDYSFYVAVIITCLLITPIIYWNIQHDFISFSFHGNRVANAFQIRPDYFFREVAGQIAYNNPLNYMLIVMAFIGVIKKKIVVDQSITILLWNSLPLYCTFTGFSLFRSTLPHWTGPAFLAPILIAAIYWSSVNKNVNSTIPRKIIFPVYFLLVMVFIAVYLINYSPFPLGKTSDVAHYDEGDFTQDMYGWESIGPEFKKIALEQERISRMPKNADLISFRWFPGAHEDFYVARPLHRNLYLIGELKDIHKYFWINQQRGGLVKGKDYYHIAVSNYYEDPQILFGAVFEKIEPLDTIQVTRAGVVMREAFVYKLKKYRGTRL